MSLISYLYPNIIKKRLTNLRLITNLIETWGFKPLKLRHERQTYRRKIYRGAFSSRHDMYFNIDLTMATEF